MSTYLMVRRDIFAVFIAIGIISFIVDAFNMGYDSTDGHKRSGMSLHIDNLTGCHYLYKGDSLIKRVDSGGNQICAND